MSWILPWRGEEWHLVCVSMLFVNVLLNAGKRKITKDLSNFPWSVQRTSDASHWCCTAWVGDSSLRLVSTLITFSPPPLIHLFFPLSQCPNWLLLAWLSRLAAFTETAPKRRLGCGRMWRGVRTYLCLCDFGWHKSSQHCPLVKESNYFGTFQPCPIVSDVYLFLLFFILSAENICVYISGRAYYMN